MNNQAAQTMPELPASVLADLIDWHKRDGTKKGKLTTQALQELAEYRTRAAALAQTAGVPDGWRSTVEALVRHIESETCTHEETHRGGAIWEICDSCGAQWADDRGGRPEFTWPECVENARAMLAAAPAASGVHPDALPDGTLSKSTAKRVDALRMAQGEVIEPIGYRYRHPDGLGGWHDWIMVKDMPSKTYPSSQYEPMYGPVQMAASWRSGYDTRDMGSKLKCIWPDCGHDTNQVGYSPGCTGVGCPARTEK